MINKKFYESLDLIAIEHHIEREDVFNSVRKAFIKAVEAEGHTGKIEVEFNDEEKKIRIFEVFRVIDESITEVKDPETGEMRPVVREAGDISLEQAKKIKARVRIGSTFRNEIDIKSIERKGATKFKQIFRQDIKETQVRRSCEYFKNMLNEVVTGTVEKTTDKAVIFNVGYNTTAYMALKDGVPGEVYEPGKSFKVVISSIVESDRSPNAIRIFVKRNNTDIINRLFETYIPEVANGVIDIVRVARESGSRTKIGVRSNNPNVDPKGSCVGVNGSRIKEINRELNDERIDIFEWQTDPAKNIIEALTPAKVLNVLIVDPDKNSSIAIVPDDQFSLAIGKGGQNARLASKVTGWQIDIKSETTALQEGLSVRPTE